MKIAYARGSTGERHLELRLDVRKQAGRRRTFREKIARAWGSAAAWPRVSGATLSCWCLALLVSPSAMMAP